MGKLSEEDYPLIQTRINAGVIYADIVKEFGISKGLLKKLVGQGVFIGRKEAVGELTKEMVCEYAECDKKFERRITEIKHSAHSFCSRSCSAKFHNQQRKANHPNGYERSQVKNNKDDIKVVCARTGCTREFYLSAARIKKHFVPLCSQRCVGIFYADTSIKEVEDMDQDVVESVLRSYINATSIKAIKADTGVSSLMIKRILDHKRLDYPGVKAAGERKAHKEQTKTSFPRRSRKGVYKWKRNSTAFTTKPGAAYWLGFMITDGYVSKDLRTVGLCLSIRDSAHVEKFRSFIEYEGGPNRQRSDEQVVCMVVDYQIASSLNSYGIKPQKTLTAKVDNKWAGSFDFWRGVIDGDGSITAEVGRYAIALASASLPLIHQYLDFLRNLYGVDFSVYTKKKGNREPLHSVTVHGKYAKHLATCLYDVAPEEDRLERKYRTARRLIDEPYRKESSNKEYREFLKKHPITAPPN